MKKANILLFLFFLTNSSLFSMSNEKEQTIGYLKIRATLQDGSTMKKTLTCKTKSTTTLSIEMEWTSIEKIIEYLKSVDNIEKVHATVLLNKEFQENESYITLIIKELARKFSKAEIKIETNNSHA